MIATLTLAKQLARQSANSMDPQFLSLSLSLSLSHSQPAAVAVAAAAAAAQRGCLLVALAQKGDATAAQWA